MRFVNSTILITYLGYSSLVFPRLDLLENGLIRKVTL